ncbi:hypothetical protein DMB44_04155 [Thermoplasma sp. Kam2015]|nr:hypothetical protein DMB44_04155 [Thermoplasma sp. Kam2015]
MRDLQAAYYEEADLHKGKYIEELSKEVDKVEEDAHIKGLKQVNDFLTLLAESVFRAIARDLFETDGNRVEWVFNRHMVIKDEDGKDLPKWVGFWPDYGGRKTKEDFFALYFMDLVKGMSNLIDFLMKPTDFLDYKEVPGQCERYIQGADYDPQTALAIKLECVRSRLKFIFPNGKFDLEGDDEFMLRMSKAFPGIFDLNLKK